MKSFAREEFALKHRYAMVLHTDEPHPHVHVVVKAVSEQGARLNIRKAILREWRRQFARHLREQDISANATERAVRSEIRTRLIDPIYRATLRGGSTRTRGRTEAVVSELLKGNLHGDPGKVTLVASRRAVELGWAAASDILLAQGLPELAEQVRCFAGQMSAPRSDKELLAAALTERARGQRLPDQNFSR